MSALNQTAVLTLLTYAWIICSFRFLPKSLTPKSRIRLFNCCFPLICRALQMGTYLFLSLFLNSYYSGLSGSWASFYTHGAPSTWATFSFNSGLLHLKGPLKTLTGYPLPCTILSVSGSSLQSHRFSSQLSLGAYRNTPKGCGVPFSNSLSLPPQTQILLQQPDLQNNKPKWENLASKFSQSTTTTVQTCDPQISSI